MALRRALDYLGLFLPAAFLVCATFPGNRFAASIIDFCCKPMVGGRTVSFAAVRISHLSYRGQERDAAGKPYWTGRRVTFPVSGTAILPFSSPGPRQRPRWRPATTTSGARASHSSPSRPRG
ncbi:hypothetical protein R5H32_08395 [Defluviimonas sp. D31]|uniref:hypothetical protein n=1 Tax=Defluviimonas sp. D31 TaxID=3083253 RepID=UPI00296FAE93|nr:hypothetical protein [Defluviimonas sp. D31]MDW4549367.1 hypothetical protein [Defluviimonas sp. D31]